MQARRGAIEARLNGNFVTADTTIEGASMGANSVLSVWQSFELGARSLLAKFKTTFCDECSGPIRCWHRRVWVVKGERRAHLQCWSGQLFIRGYVQLMAEEIRARRSDHSTDKDPAEPELRELRASAQALRERAERLEAQLQHAEETRRQNSY